jgi:hypothetical protein
VHALRLAIAASTLLALSGLGGCDPADPGEPIDPDVLPCVPGRAPDTDAVKPFCYELDLDLLTAELSTPLFDDGAEQGGPSRISPAIHIVASGADLEIVGGNQGLHMVVLGFRTAAVTQGNLRVSATLTAQSGESASREWSKRGIEDGRDGYGYHLNLILVVDDVPWRDWVGHPATVTLVVSTTDGLLIGRAIVEVTLRSTN